jgi:hypothetical protein
MEYAREFAEAEGREFNKEEYLKLQEEEAQALEKLWLEDQGHET